MFFFLLYCIDFRFISFFISVRHKLRRKDKWRNPILDAKEEKVRDMIYPIKDFLSFHLINILVYIDLLCIHRSIVHVFVSNYSTFHMVCSFLMLFRDDFLLNSVKGNDTFNTLTTMAHKYVYKKYFTGHLITRIPVSSIFTLKTI